LTDDELNYGSYLALGELLALQRPRSEPEHPDELLFIIVHQSSELWFKLILHELDALHTRLGDNDTLGALDSMKRVNALVRIVTSQLNALETLPPQRFAQFREHRAVRRAFSSGQSKRHRGCATHTSFRFSSSMEKFRR
jgi:tryptophan 2,3-dioxygenase